MINKSIHNVSKVVFPNSKKVLSVDEVALSEFAFQKQSQKQSNLTVLV